MPLISKGGKSHTKFCKNTIGRFIGPKKRYETLPVWDNIIIIIDLSCQKRFNLKEKRLIYIGILKRSLEIIRDQ